MIDIQKLTIIFCGFRVFNSIAIIAVFVYQVKLWEPTVLKSTD